jgi:hypothetical protein
MHINGGVPQDSDLFLGIPNHLGYVYFFSPNIISLHFVFGLNIMQVIVWTWTKGTAIATASRHDAMLKAAGSRERLCISRGILRNAYVINNPLACLFGWDHFCFQ